MYKKPPPPLHDSWGNLLIFGENLAIQHICRHHMIKLIKITKNIITRVVKMTLLFTHWLSLPKHTTGHFDYSTLEAHISNTKNDRNKQISDSKSRHIEYYTWLRGRSICKCNIHVQRDAQRPALIYPRTTLRIFQDRQLMSSTTTSTARRWSK